MDDRDAHLPGEPRAGQAPRRAARAARRRAARTHRRAHADVRFRLAAPPTEAGRDPGRHDRGRDAPHRDRGVDRLPGRPRTSRSRRRAPAAYVVERGGQVKDDRRSPAAIASRRARPARRSARPPQAGDALYLGFDGTTSRTSCIAGRRSTARRRAAPASIRRIRRFAGRSSGRAATVAEAEVLEDLTGGFNYGPGAVELQCPPRHRDRVDRRPSPALAPLPARPTRRARGAAGATYTHPPEIYAIAAAPIGALVARRARRAGDRGAARRERRDARPDRSRCASLRCSPPTAEETLEVREPGSGPLGRSGRWSSRLPSPAPTDRHFVLDATAAQIELGPPSASLTAAGRSTARPAEGARRCGWARYRHGGGRGGKRRGRDADDAAQRDSRGRVRDEPAAGVRRRRSRVARAAPAARGAWRSGPGTARSRPRISSSSSARPRRGSAATICLRAGERPPIRFACTSFARVAPADRRSTYEELMPDEELLSEVAAYLDERRVIGTTVHLLPVQAARRHRSSSTSRPSRTPTSQRVEEEVAPGPLHVPEPAGRRFADRPGKRLGVRPRCSTRASSTGSSTRSTASSSSRSCASTRPTSRPASRLRSPPAVTSRSSPMSCWRPARHVVRAVHPEIG